MNIKNLSLAYPPNQKWILDGLNLKLSKGESLALIGSSGSGKSTLAKLLLQILPQGTVYKGEVRFHNQDLMNLTIDELERLRGELIGLVFQDPASRLNPLMTVGKHLLDTLQAHLPEKSSKWIRWRAEELLSKVGIDPKRFNAYPHEFSGGMRQRLAIALAIALNPPLIIADEPTSSLDVVIANQIMDQLSILCDEMGSSLLLISHDLALVSRWCQRIAILDNGQIVEDRFNEDFLTTPKSLLGKKLVTAARSREEFIRSSKPEQESVLEVDRLRCWHSLGGLPWRSNWIKAIDQVSFSLNVGETLGIVGASGCGKSTLCRALLGLMSIRGGEVRLEGKNLATLDRQTLKIARRSMQMVFQDPLLSLNPKLTVLETIVDPFLIHGITSISCAKEQARSLLLKVGLTPVENFQNRFPYQISGGQQQRVAIARALALKPKVLICDESLSMLDAEIQVEILQLLSSLQKNLGVAIIFVTHDLYLASSFCDRVLVLDQGKIVEQGVAQTIIRQPKVALTQKLVKASPRITSIN